MNKINDLERAKLREEMYYCEVARRTIEANGLIGLDDSQKELDKLLDNIDKPIVYPIKRNYIEAVLLTIYPINKDALRLESNIWLDMNSKARTINMIYKRGRNISLMTNSDLTQTHNYCEQIPAQARALKIR